MGYLLYGMSWKFCILEPSEAALQNDIHGMGMGGAGEKKRQARYNLLEMFVFALIGILCGLLGAAFNHFNGRLTRL